METKKLEKSIKLLKEYIVDLDNESTDAYDQGNNQIGNNKHDVARNLELILFSLNLKVEIIKKITDDHK